MGYPWSDGFSLISNDLNPAIDHTTLPLGAFSPSMLVTMGSNVGFSSYQSGTAMDPTIGMSIVIKNISATGSWTVVMGFNQAGTTAAMGGAGSIVSAWYWNGAKIANSLSHVSPNDGNWQAKEEHLRLVGVGTVQLYSACESSTGSFYTWGPWEKYCPIYMIPRSGVNW